jgi:hypothetical protein
MGRWYVADAQLAALKRDGAFANQKYSLAVR